MKEKDVDMKKLMEIAKMFESSSEQAGKLEKQLLVENVTVSDSAETGQVNFVSPRRNDRNASGNRGTGKMYCYGCGARDHVHGDKQCPASDKTCFNCDLKGDISYRKLQ